MKQHIKDEAIYDDVNGTVSFLDPTTLIVEDKDGNTQDFQFSSEGMITNKTIKDLFNEDGTFVLWWG